MRAGVKVRRDVYESPNGRPLDHAPACPPESAEEMVSFTRWRDEQASRERDAVNEARSEGLARCLTADELFAEETSANLVVPGLGICPGPPTGLVGQAYVGKTIVALSAGISVALGKALWGMWSVQQGPWLHLDYEQGRRHTKSRVRRLARGFGVPDEQLRALIVAREIRVAVFPNLRLTTDGAAEHFRRLFEGVRFVTCDSLRMMLGGVDENRSEVRSLMGALSSASDATGAAVALIHHGGKTPLEGQRARKETPRGSSGIVDELQSLFVMTRAKGDDCAVVTHEKDRELGEPLADFGLRIEDVASEDEPKWGLRVAHVDREEMKPKADGADAAFKRAAAAVVECIGANPGIAGAEAVVARSVGCRAQTVRAAVKQLTADGEIVTRSAPRRGVRLYLKHAAPVEIA